MKGFIELTTTTDYKCLINVNNINSVYIKFGDVFISTNSDSEGLRVHQTYTQVKELIEKAIES